MKRHLHDSTAYVASAVSKGPQHLPWETKNWRD
jgi:hypothetical protein